MELLNLKPDGRISNHQALINFISLVFIRAISKLYICILVGIQIFNKFVRCDLKILHHLQDTIVDQQAVFRS